MKPTMLLSVSFFSSILVNIILLVVISRRDEEIRKLENIISGLKSELSKHRVYEYITRETGDPNDETVVNNMEELYGIVKKAKVVLNLGYLDINKEACTASIRIRVKNKPLSEKVYVCTFSMVDKLVNKNLEYYGKIREYTIQQHEKVYKR